MKNLKSKIYEIFTFIIGSMIGIMGCFISMVVEIIVLITAILGVLWLLGFIK